MGGGSTLFFGQCKKIWLLLRYLWNYSDLHMLEWFPQSQLLGIVVTLYMVYFLKFVTPMSNTICNMEEFPQIPDKLSNHTLAVAFTLLKQVL